MPNTHSRVQVSHSHRVETLNTQHSKHITYHFRSTCSADALAEQSAAGQRAASELRAAKLNVAGLEKLAALHAKEMARLNSAMGAGKETEAALRAGLAQSVERASDMERECASLGRQLAKVCIHTICSICKDR